MKLSRYIGAVSIVLTALSLASCGEIKRGEYAAGTDAVFCDDGFKNILDEEIQAFEFTYKDATILPFYTSEQACIDSLLADKCQSIIITRDFTPEEKKYVKSENKR